MMARSPLESEIFDALPDAVVIVDESGTIVMTNSLAEIVFRADGPLTGSPVEDLIPEAQRSTHRRHRQAFAASAQRRAMGVGLELVALRSDGTTFPADISLSPIDVDGEHFTMASVRDISERRMAERELRTVHERLATMEDRERIARDLHDIVIQEIFGAGLSLQASLAGIEDPVLRDRIAGTADRLDETIGKLRSVIFDLHRHRQRTSVEEAMIDVVDAAAVQLGYGPRLELLGPRLPDIAEELVSELAVTLREALTNVGKHANATAVDIVVRADEELALVVNDDGVGIGEVEFGGFGLRNMSERAELLGGSFAIGAREHGGTRLEWRVPIR